MVRLLLYCSRQLLLLDMLLTLLEQAQPMFFGACRWINALLQVDCVRCVALSVTANVPAV
jgi:hypothetical protein